jgi:hypothetical protein
MIYAMTATSSTEATGADLGAAAALPMISGLSPNFGLMSGGTSVTIRGSNLGHPIAVRFGPTNGKITKVVSATEIVVECPAGTGVVNAVVTTPSGASSTGPATHFTYYGNPAVSGVEPSAGLVNGNTTVYVRGKNLIGATAVRFGSAEAKIVKVIGPGDVEVITPKGIGVVDVVVITPLGTTPKWTGDRYTYREGDPSISGLSPNQGTATGGTAVTITGTNLLGATAVHFGTAAGTIQKQVSLTKLIVTSPAGQGTVNVTVTTPVGMSRKTDADRFSYVVGASRHPDPAAVRAHTRARKNA